MHPGVQVTAGEQENTEIRVQEPKQPRKSRTSQFPAMRFQNNLGGWGRKVKKEGKENIINKNSCIIQDKTLQYITSGSFLYRQVN